MASVSNSFLNRYNAPVKRLENLNKMVFSNKAQDY
jgi:hypothetical protein